ncbi:MAG: MliC family protein [Hyphomicrobium sp.]|uniref:MliC family protein n=1 Tax=Hyphomicrobium sp. TaxID=82 RepID=UPI0039E676CE
MAKATIAILGIVCVSSLPLSGAYAQDEFHYVCADGTKLSASFKPSSAQLKFEGKDELTLPQVLSADGGRYAVGDTEFWIKGRDATLTRGQNRTTCKS